MTPDTISCPQNPTVSYSGPVPCVAPVAVVVVLFRQLVTLPDNRRLVATVAYHARHEPLTGLSNRALFASRLAAAVDRHGRDGMPFAVLFVDVDDFKSINDSLGHDVGDGVLVSIARRLVGCVRDDEAVARLVGDEFAMRVEDSTENAALALANRLVDEFARPLVVDDHALPVRLSIGRAAPRDGGGDVSVPELPKQVGLAMCTAKRTGSGGVHVFTPDVLHVLV